MATHAWELSKALAQLGHKVTVLTGAKVHHAGSRFALTKKEKLDGVQVINFGFKLGLRRYYKYWLNRELRHYLVGFKEVHKDVVLHIHEHMRPLSIRRVSRLPIVWTNHSSMFLRDFEDDSKREDLVSMVKSCDWVTAPSQELCAKTVALGYPMDRVTYIPNGVDTSRFTPNGKCDDRLLAVGGNTLRFPRSTCVVLCARRFVHKNGLHTYLDALESMSYDMLAKCAFVFAGNKPGQDGEYGQKILERIKALSLKTSFYLLGPVRNDSMPEVYRTADIAVLPSLMEATSITGLESMASGLPIVGTNVGGIPELVEDGVSGLLCPPDAAALAKNLAKLIREPNLRLKMGSKARRFAEERFSWYQIAGRFIEVYQKVLDYRRSAVATN